jgi:secreted PhoX family phosphatase
MNRLSVVYDGLASAGPLTDPDAITVAPSGDVYVAEDTGNMEVCIITAGSDRVVAPFLRLVGHPGSECAGLAFNPAGDRLYVSSMRAHGGVYGEGGVTFEVTGPFRPAPTQRPRKPPRL